MPTNREMEIGNVRHTQDKGFDDEMNDEEEEAGRRLSIMSMENVFVFS